MGKKKYACLLILMVIIIIAGYSYRNYLCNTKVVFPLKNIESIEDAANMQICILNDAQDKVLFNIKDPVLLYDNRNLFSIYNDNDVYKTTPQYVVKILKNDEIQGVYYLINLKQINFGTIPYRDK